MKKNERIEKLEKRKKKPTKKIAKLKKAKRELYNKIEQLGIKVEQDIKKNKTSKQPQNKK